MEIKGKLEEIYSSLITERDYIKHDLQLAQNYSTILEEAKNSLRGDFVNRGVVMCCANPKNGILITGINPSQRGESRDSYFYTFKETMSDPERRKGSYWRNKYKQLINEKDNDFLLNHTAYLDLFPYVESSQNKFSKEIKDNVDFQRKVLLLTFAEIEQNICPKLIIAANSKSSFYWGINKKHPWMGYALEKVKEMPPCLIGKDIKLYQIKSETGFCNHKERVIQEMESAPGFKESSLNGKYFIEYGMYDERHEASHPERILKPKDVMSLYNWVEEKCNNH